MKTSLIKPTRVDLDEINLSQITRILMSGNLDALSPGEREYYSLMEMVRGLRAKMRHNNKVITKAGIIKLLKSDVYGLSDWQARQVYADSLNFFYAQENVRPEAFANLYADKLEKWADAAFLMGKEKEAGALIEKAAKLRGCYEKKETEIPEELLNQKQTVVYTTKRSDLGVDDIDRKDLEEFIDAIPDVPRIVQDNVKMDAGIKKFNLKNRMIHDIQEFSTEESED